jgi:Protein of unknown function (DUF1360)
VRDLTIGTVDAALICLAVARLTTNITADRIPFGRLRGAIVAAGQAHAEHIPTPDGGTVEVLPAWAELATCPWCISMWLAPAVVAVSLRWPSRARPVMLALAASEVAGILGGYAS